MHMQNYTHVNHVRIKANRYDVRKTNMYMYVYNVHLHVQCTSVIGVSGSKPSI